MINRTQKSPGTATVALGRAPARGGENALNIHNNENGIALANVNPSRPRMIVCSESLAVRADEMLMIHPAIARTESPKRWFTAARRL